MAVGSSIAVTPGSGAKIATGPTYTENSNTVQDQKVIRGEPYLASYKVITGGLILTTTSTHLLQIMAGSSLNVYIRRISLQQLALATSAGTAIVDLFRLTSAGTGGSVLTAVAKDTADSAPGATVMSMVVTPGSLAATAMHRFVTPVTNAQPANSTVWEWKQMEGAQSKAIKIPAGTANGIALVLNTAATPATLIANVEFDEAPF